MSSPMQHPNRQSLTLPPNGQPRRDNFSSSSDSNYKEDARAVEVWRSQIHPKWWKPTIKEQEAFDEEFEQEVEQSLQAPSQPNAEDNEDKEDKDNDEDEDDNDDEDDDEKEATHKAGPIPLEAKGHAFESYKKFMEEMEALAKETGKPIQSLLKLVGTTKWGAYQAWYGVYGNEKNLED
ncbi:hypothetical protein H0H92_001180, partial [Tricholoma furcatifolium]